MKKYFEKQLYIKTFELTRSPKVTPESAKYFLCKNLRFLPKLIKYKYIRISCYECLELHKAYVTFFANFDSVGIVPIHKAKVK